MVISKPSLFIVNDSKKKISIILSRFPYPLDKGDKLRAFHQLKHLAQQFDIELYVLTDKNISQSEFNHVSPYCVQIHIFQLNKLEMIFQLFKSLFKKIPVQVAYFFSPRVQQKISNLILESNPDLIFCQLSRTALYAKDLNVPKIIDFQDAFSTNYLRIQENYKGFRKYFFKRESKLTKTFEQSMLQWFDASTIISSFDKNEIAAQNENLKVISNGVDTDFFKTKNIEKEYDILFFGNLSYIPNRNAVIYLAEKIVPILVQKKNNIKIHIAGAQPKDLTKYESKNIHVSGWLDDSREAYNTAKIFVAPLFTGAGLQNKLLEAMSMELPCITTNITNASLKATNLETVIIANNETEFAEAIINLLDNESLQSHLKLIARRFVENCYSWKAPNQKLVDLFNSVIKNKKM